MLLVLAGIYLFYLLETLFSLIAYKNNTHHHHQHHHAVRNRRVLHQSLKLGFQSEMRSKWLSWGTWP